MNTLSRFWRTLYEIVQFLSLLAFIPSIALFFIQQRDQRRSDAEERAMNMIMMANSGEILAAKNRTIAPWLNVDVKGFYDKSPTDEAIAKFEDDLGVDKVEKLDLLQLGDFYQTVLACRDSGVCDRSIIDRHLRGDMAGFYCNYGSRLDAIAANFGQPEAYRALMDYSACGEETTGKQDSPLLK